MRIEELTDIVLSGKNLSFAQAMFLTEVSLDEVLFLIECANRISKKFNKTEIDLCSIMNAKSGQCSEDCKFCSQSIHYSTNISNYKLVTAEQMLVSAKKAKQNNAIRFCIVTSGCNLEDKDFENVCASALLIRKNVNIQIDASLGELTSDRVKLLKQSGITKYNHNIETAKSFFSQVCTTHTFEDRLQTINLCKEQNLKLCTGGILGLGETYKQRIEFAFILKDLDVDMIPLNFLNTISGTPFENNQSIPALEILKIISIFRFILSDKDIKVCGGREKNLRSLQPLLFFAGANGIIIGDYLTIKGQLPQDDLMMINDLQLSLRKYV